MCRNWQLVSDSSEESLAKAEVISVGVIRERLLWHPISSFEMTVYWKLLSVRASLSISFFLQLLIVNAHPSATGNPSQKRWTLSPHSSIIRQELIVSTVVAAKIDAMRRDMSKLELNRCFMYALPSTAVRIAIFYPIHVVHAFDVCCFFSFRLRYETIKLTDKQTSKKWEIAW